VKIRGITKSYPAIGGPGITTAVDNVSLTIEPGELFFLLGPSGCGKTTLLRMIAGFIDPTAGAIAFADAQGERDVTHLPPEKRNTGMVFQSYALWPHMTVAQNVAFGLDVRKVKGDQKQRRVMEALAAVHMDAYAQRKPTQLSGGQQQRVALARALVVRPSVLLLDEPLSNLDAKLRHELRSEIRRICKQAGITTVYVTHDQKEALSMADRVAVMRAGVVEQLGTPRDLYRRPTSRFVAEFLGETNLLPGEATRNQGGHEVRVSFGVLHAAASNPPTAIAGPCFAAVRPEAVVVSERITNDGLTGTVVSAEYLGDSAQIMVEVGGVMIKSSTLNPRDGAMTPGTKVSVRIDPADVCLVPRDDRDPPRT
jgi:iron(III) transport system ATP-binding protein